MRNTAEVMRSGSSCTPNTATASSATQRCRVRCETIGASRCASIETRHAQRDMDAGAAHDHALDADRRHQHVNAASAGDRAERVRGVHSADGPLAAAAPQQRM